MLNSLGAHAVLSDKDCLLLCQNLIINQIVVEVDKALAGKLTLDSEQSFIK